MFSTSDDIVSISVARTCVQMDYSNVMVVNGCVIPSGKGSYYHSVCGMKSQGDKI